MRQLIYTTLRPDMYHGHGKKPPYFEGWYYKMVSADEAHRYAVIPGIILGNEGHAFIQVLDGSSGHSSYHTFPRSEFWASRSNFDLRIGPNRFTNQGIDLDIHSPEVRINGALQFENPVPWPVSWSSPGIMGWYAWVPRMECYHGVLSFDHPLHGHLNIDGQRIDFTGGRGYIEKDWGQSFPAAWVWFQSNHFANPGTSITASVAIIPWLSSAFRGFIIGLWHDQNLYRFATYTKATIEKLAITDDHVDWIVMDQKHKLVMSARRAEGGLLLGPTRVEMGKRVTETLNAEIDICLLSNM